MLVDSTLMTPASTIAMLVISFFVLFYLTSAFIFLFFFFLMIRRPPRSTLFPTRRSSDLGISRRRTHRGGPSDRRADAPGSAGGDRKSTRLNSSHLVISYAVFCLKKKNGELDGGFVCDAEMLDQVFALVLVDGQVLSALDA